MFSPAIQACLSITTAPESQAVISEDFTSCVTGEGQEWANILQSLTCSGGTGHGTAETTTVAYHQTPVGSLDHWVAGTIYFDQTNDGTGLLLGSNGTEYYYASIAGGNLYIRDDTGNFEAYDGGGHAQGSYTLAVQISTDGSSHATFSAWINGSPVSLTGATDTNDRVTRGQYVGVYIRRGQYNNDITVDNLTAGTGTYTP